MIATIKRHIRKYSKIKMALSLVYKPIRSLYNAPKINNLVKNDIQTINNIPKGEKKIFYCGRPIHPNLGDQAQAYCILRWLKDNFSEYKIIELHSQAIVHKNDEVILAMKSRITNEDFIVFQSGYCTTDLHGVDEKMHRTVIQNFPENLVLSLPQTINFKSKEEAMKSSEIYNNHNKLMVVARDSVSFNTANQIFSCNKLYMYPDIVTSLIGTYDDKQNKREGILFCIRNDAESYYNINSIKDVMSNLKSKYKCNVDLTDTTISVSSDKVVNDIENILRNEFDMFSKYKLIVTDRYHGTIFSLISKTPVIVLKTNDYKVSSGVDWFKEEYPNYIAFSENLDYIDGYVEKMINTNIKFSNEKTLYQKYYDELAKFVKEEL